MPAETLYAWACPIGGWRGADHTWVTSCPAPLTYPPVPGYWYCWGPALGGAAPRPRLLWAGRADLRLARRICPPDDPSAHGGVFPYGVRGLSHQAANRVLFSSVAYGQPVTVQGAHMYWLSFLFYGTYGSDGEEWMTRLVLERGLPPESSADPDEHALSQVVRSMLGSAYTERVEEEIHALRRETRHRKASMDRAVVAGSVDGESYAERVNRLASEVLRGLGAVLGRDHCARIFDASPGEYVELLDPGIAGGCAYGAGLRAVSGR